MKCLFLPLLLSVLCSAIVLAEPAPPVRSRIRRQPVISTSIASVGYSRRLRALEIEFSRGAIYRFLDVGPGIYQRLIAAQSKGRFVAENIRGKYRFIRIRPDRANAAVSGLTTNEPQPAHGVHAP